MVSGAYKKKSTAKRFQRPGDKIKKVKTKMGNRFIIIVKGGRKK